ncbi:MAG: alpha/beta hydrolase [Candidatus Methanofastidiosia archaeon]|jgi:pimeloyl-ACP methyl ester carboxylesterase
MKKSFDEIYRKVPPDQREYFKKFRERHPHKTCECNTVSWEYISCGTGEPLVLLPGGVRSCDTWFKMITALENQYKIVSPTYPALKTMASIIHGIIHILELEKVDKGHILGTSFGGWVAQCIVRSNPEKVETLILSHTSAPGSISNPVLTLAEILTYVYPEWLLQSALKRRYYSLLSVPDFESAFWKAFTEELSLNTTKDDIKAQQKCTRDFEKNYEFSPNDLSDWPGRILLIESDNDPAFTVSVREALKGLYPTAQVYTFENAGHTPGYTNPDEYIRVLKEFLAE